MHIAPTDHEKMHRQVEQAFESRDTRLTKSSPAPRPICVQLQVAERTVSSSMSGCFHFQFRPDPPPASCNKERYLGIVYPPREYSGVLHQSQANVIAHIAPNRPSFLGHSWAYVPCGEGGRVIEHEQEVVRRHGTPSLFLICGNIILMSPYAGQHPIPFFLNQSS